MSIEARSAVLLRRRLQSLADAFINRVLTDERQSVYFPRTTLRGSTPKVATAPRTKGIDLSTHARSGELR